MKKLVVIFILITLMGGRYSTIFASYSEEQEMVRELEMEIENIFQRRMVIWNTFLTDEQESLSSVEAKLKEIVTQPLLAMDVETFQHLRENPADYELINRVLINSCEVQRLSSNSALVEVQMLWELQSFTDVHMEQVNYVVEMKKLNNKWLMSDYYLLK